MSSFVDGQGAANALNGFLGHVDQPAKDLVQTLGEGFAQLSGSALKRNGHASPTSEE